MTAIDRDFRKYSGPAADAVETPAANVQIDLAASLEDFQATMTLLWAMVDELGLHAGEQRFGHLLSRLRHGGTGPEAGGVLIARRGGHAVGCLVLSTTDGGDAVMRWLYVEKTQRRNGIGRALIEAAIRQASVWRRRRLTAVVPLNGAPLLRLCARVGFQIAPESARFQGTADSRLTLHIPLTEGHLSGLAA